MNWVDWIDLNQDWVIFFGSYFVLFFIIFLIINPRGKKRSGFAFIIGVSNIFLFILPSPYNFLFLIGNIISIIFLLNGKHTWNITTSEPEGLFINSKPSIYRKYNEPPESKQWQEKHKEEAKNE